MPMFKQFSTDECPPIGEVRVPEPEMPVWLDDLRGHAVFRDELGMCVVGGAWTFRPHAIQAARCVGRLGRTG